MTFEWLVGAGWTESTFASNGISEAFGFFDDRIGDAFANQLCDTVTFLNLKIDVRKIEQNDANVAAVVLIDDTGTNVNWIFPCQARTWCNTAVGSFWHLDLNVGLNELFATSRNNVIVGTANTQEWIKFTKINKNKEMTLWSVEIYLRKSNPAACSEPLVGANAFGVNLAKRNTEALSNWKNQ